MAISDNFAVFILTHGRPNNVKTYNTLIKQGYTGPIYIVIDNEDKSAPQYYDNFGDKVIMFDKADIATKFDTGDNFSERRSVVFARNACFEIARDLGIEYFLQLDDDYRAFMHRFTPDLRYNHRPVKNGLDRLFQVMLDYYKSIDAITIAFSQGGDYIGGEHSTSVKKLWLKRKAMNTFFCSTSRPFDFIGRVNEDVNSYTSLGRTGKLMFTIFNASINQVDTQSNSGGMTELYLQEGTYIKSFYTVMYAPSCTKISLMSGQQNREPRIHHKINWKAAAPQIVSEDLRKRSHKTPELVESNGKAN